MSGAAAPAQGAEKKDRVPDFDPVYRDRKAYKLWVNDTLRFCDLDALGHLNSGRTGEYFIDARATLFLKAIPGWPAECPQLPVIKTSFISHEREAHFPSEVETGLAVERMGRTSFSLVMGAFEKGGECFALSRNVFVFIDSKARKPVEPSAEIVAAFKNLAG